MSQLPPAIWNRNILFLEQTDCQNPVVPLFRSEEQEKENFKIWLSHNNIPFKENNGFLFFRYNEKLCLYFEPYFKNNLCRLSSFLLSNNIKYINHTFAYLEVKNFEKPYIYTAEKIYEMVKSLSQRYWDTFYENLSLDDIFYLPDINEYFILTKKNSIWYGYNLNKITIHWINLFRGKSIYTFNGNEINNYNELEILLGGNYGKNTSW